MHRLGLLAAIAGIAAVAGCDQSRSVEGTPIHPSSFPPTEHGPAFFAFMSGAPGSLDCAGCHGQIFDEQNLEANPFCTACHTKAGWTAEWGSNCSFCHGTKTQAGFDLATSPQLAAPPDDVQGRLTGTNSPDKVGAHQVHLVGSAIASRFACETCHTVPDPSAPFDHLATGVAQVKEPLDGSGRASFPAALGSYDSSAKTCAVYCHGGAAGGPSGGTTGAPAWSGSLPKVGGAFRCDACHGNSIAGAPNTFYPDTGHHDRHSLLQCAYCHNGIVTAVPTGTAPAIADPSRHVNGTADVVFGGDFNGPVTGSFSGGATPTCSSVSCHGSGTLNW